LHAATEREKELRRQQRGLLLHGGASTELDAIQAELREMKLRRLRDNPRLKKDDCLSDRYLLDEELGRGGFATVWKAFDEEERRVVAVKVLHGQFADSPERLDRFRRGARAMKRLVHPRIVRLLEAYREDGGNHYFVMEFVPGGTFLRAVRDRKLSAGQIGRVILQVGAALEHAHGQGVIHRDVTPDNILLAQDGSAKLTDFDLVRLPDSTADTRTGALGKFVYVAPECLESARHADRRCDVYSLGMTAIFGFHGQPLTPTVLTRRKAFLKQLNLPARLKAVLARATRRDPEKRFGSVKEFCVALRDALKPRRPSPPDEPRPTVDQRAQVVGTAIEPR
jgi:serine/threonine protein kinase